MVSTQISYIVMNNYINSFLSIFLYIICIKPNWVGLGNRRFDPAAFQAALNYKSLEKQFEDYSKQYIFNMKVSVVQEQKRIFTHNINTMFVEDWDLELTRLAYEMYSENEYEIEHGFLTLPLVQVRKR